MIYQTENMHGWNNWFYSGRMIDEALRYMPVADFILKDRMECPAILDIGSGPKGVTKYLTYRVVGLDRRFNGNISKNLIPVEGDGTRLPFKDRSFDYVMSVDNLEHIPPRFRSQLLCEMLRVARRKVFLAVPCDGDAEEQDRRLDRLYVETYGERYPFLIEHVDYGLPVTGDVLEVIKEAAKKQGMRIKEISVIPNVNLTVRYLYMQLWISRHKPFRVLYRLMMVLSHIRKWLNFGRCYRKIFVIEVGR